MIFFYHRCRITGWGPEKADSHPSHAREKFRHTDPVVLTKEEERLSLDELSLLYPNENNNPVPVFKSRRNLPNA